MPLNCELQDLLGINYLTQMVTFENELALIVWRFCQVSLELSTVNWKRAGTDCAPALLSAAPYQAHCQ